MSKKTFIVLIFLILVFSSLGCVSIREKPMPPITPTKKPTVIPPTPTTSPTSFPTPTPTPSPTSTAKYSIEVIEGLLVTTKTGDKIYVRIYKPKATGKFPTVVYIPGGLCEGVFTKAGSTSLMGLAEEGIVEVYFNPPGRGSGKFKSEGTIDYNGFKDQDSLAALIDYLKSQDYVDSSNMGVVSFSNGVTLATGFLGRYTDAVKFYIDAEGPSFSSVVMCDYLGEEARNRTSTHLYTSKVSLAFNDAIEDWWKEREAYRWISKFKGAYLRLQAEQDHMQPYHFFYHAYLMINNAVLGKPWFARINFNNPVNKLYSPNEIPKDLISGKPKDWKSIIKKAVLEMINLKKQEYPVIYVNNYLTAPHFYPYNKSLHKTPPILTVHGIEKIDNKIYYAASVGATGLSYIGEIEIKKTPTEKVSKVTWVYPYVLFAHSVSVQGNEILISDTKNQRVIVINKNTNEIIWDSSKYISLAYPNNAEFYNNGFLITDRDLNKVIAITRSGSLLFEITGLSQPHAAHFIDSDRIIIADSNNNRIIVVGTNGTVIKEWRGFSWPRDAEIYNNKLYVADTNNNRIAILDLNNTLLNSIKVDRPYEVDVTQEGILVSYSNVIALMDEHGNIKWSFKI